MGGETPVCLSLLTSLVFHRCRWVGKWSARGKLSKLSGSLIGSPSETASQAYRKGMGREEEEEEKNALIKIAFNRCNCNALLAIYCCSGKGHI